MTRTADQLACGSQQVASELNCSHQDDANQGRGARGGKGKKATCARAHPTRRRFGGGWRRLTSRQSCAPRQGGRPGAACRRAARGRNETKRAGATATPAQNLPDPRAHCFFLYLSLHADAEMRRAIWVRDETSGARTRNIRGAPAWGRDGIGFHLHW